MTRPEPRAPAARAGAVPVAAWLALALFAAFRVPVLTRYPPWTDETLTISLVTGRFVPMLRFLADEQTQPPLTYALLWAWRAAGGDALWWLRLMPCLFGVLTALPTLAICRRARLGRDATVLAVSLAAASQFLVFYSNELRSYALYVLLTACSLALWMRVRESAGKALRSDVVLLTGVNVLLVYTHFFGCLVVAVEWADAVITSRGRLRAMTLSGALTAASLAPWLALVGRRAAIRGSGFASGAGTIPPSLDAILDPYLRALGHSPWIVADLCVLVAVASAIVVFVARERVRQPVVVTLALAAVAPSVVAMIVSFASPRSVWIHRYMLATTLPFLVLAAASLVALLPDRARRFAFAFALWPAAVTIAGLVERLEKVPYDELTQRIEATNLGGDIYALDWNEGGPLAWQAAHRSTGRHVVFASTVDSIPADRGWLAWSENHPPAGLPPIAALIRRGYRTGPTIAVTGMYDDLLARPDSVVAVPFTRTR